MMGPRLRGGHHGGVRRRPGLRLAVVELGLFIGVLGLPDGAIGVIWPSLRRTFGRPIGDLGVLVLAGTLPYLLASTLTGRGVSRHGFGPVIAVAATVSAAALAGWAVAPVWAVAVLASGGLGLGRGAIDAGLNAYASEHEGVRRLGLLHASYGAGATGGPLLAAVALATGTGWRAAVAVLAAVALALAVTAGQGRDAWARPAAGPAAPTTPTVAARERTYDGDPAGGSPVTIILAAFVVYTGVEAATGAWAFTACTEGRGLSPTLAGAAVATYWGALTAGRLLLAACGHRVRRHAVLAGGAALTVAGLVVFDVDGGAVGVSGLALTGLGLAPVFPVMVSLVPGLVGAHRATGVIGWCIAAAGAGGPAAIAVVGILADRSGPRVVPPALLAGAIVLLGLLMTVRRLTRSPLAESIPAARPAERPSPERDVGH